MILFAFPGTGKTTLATHRQEVVDLELSEIKYDNSGVSHLNKEERKSIKRPLKSKDYKAIYVRRALFYHQDGKVVLAALNFLFPILFALLALGESDFHIVIPHYRLRKEYKKRYIGRGNNNKFIFEVMAIWYPTLISLGLLAKLFPQRISVLSKGETLEDYYANFSMPKVSYFPVKRFFYDYE